MGSCPQWVGLFKASEVCNCTPWDLAKQPSAWRNMALALIQAEGIANKQKETKQ